MHQVKHYLKTRTLPPERDLHFRGFCCCVAALFIVCFSSCRNPAIAHGEGERYVSPADPAIHYSGRWDRSTPSTPSASWPGFAFATIFEGKSLKVRMNDPGNYYNVEVDGKTTQVIGGKSGKHLTYVLAENLGAGKHHVKLQRRNINFGSPTEIEGFIVDTAALLTEPAKSQKQRVEFIGDSYTVGEGNEAVAETLGWTAKYPVTNFAKSYAPLLGEMMGAEISAVCRSGSGLICSYDGSRNNQMNVRYGWTLMENSKPAWSFDQPAMDLVVISLGLNDFNGLKNAKGEVPPADSAAFRAAYAKCIAELRMRNPDVRFLALASHVPWARENILAVVTAEKDAGKKDVFYAQYDFFPEGYVADGHPTTETHQKMAKQIFDQMKKIGLLSESGQLRDR